MRKIADEVGYINVGVIALPVDLIKKIDSRKVFEKSLADLIRNALELYLKDTCI